MQPETIMGSIVPVEAENGLVEYDSSSNRGKKRSVAWDHFDKLPYENKDAGKAKCRHCDMVLSATPKSGTSHLRRHVERCPKRIVLDIRPISIESASGDFEINIDCDPNRRKISKVWDEFVKFRGENMEDQKARCKHCHTVFSAAAKNGTSHLKRHLEKCTKRVAPFDGEMKHIVPSYYSGKQPGQCSNYMGYGVDKNELHRYILHFIVEGGFPFSLVEKSGFRQMVSKACPQFSPFSRSAVRKELFALYAKERDSCKEMLANVHGRICLSTESWKARDTNSEYISVAANFIDDNWKMHRRVLCVRPLVPVDDRLYVGDEVAYLLAQWKIGHKSFSITMDGAAHDESLASSLERGLISNKLLPDGGSLFQVHCYANVLNFTAESTLKLIADDLNKIRDLVRHVNKSQLQRKKFFDLAEKFQLAAGRIWLDIPSKWNTTNKLIDRALYYKNVFMHLVDWEHNMRSEESWLNLNLAHKFLKTIYDVTFMVTTTKYPTANIYLKGLLMVHRRMLEISKGPQCFLTDTIVGMEAVFEKYWSENNLILSCATILDPRYKVKFVEYCYMKLSGPGNVGERVSRAVNTLYCLLAEYKRSPPVGTSGVSTNFGNGNDEGDVFGDYNQFLSMSSKTQGSKSELDLYLEEPSYDLNSDLDVLEFWSKSSMRYPVLAVMARDILSVPVSSATLKSAFHIGGKTLSILTSVIPETIQALVCLQDWTQAQYESDDCTIKGEELSGFGEDVGIDDDEGDAFLAESF